MRSIVHQVQSWNWRTILIATVVFMGVYLLIFDDSTAAQPPSPVGAGAAATGPIASNVAPNPTGKKSGQTSHVKGAYDDRWDDNALFEESYPLLGEEYDSPVDAVPGRVRPVKEPQQETQQEEPKEEQAEEIKEEVVEEKTEEVAGEAKEEVEETTESPTPTSTPIPTPKSTRKKKPRPKTKSKQKGTKHKPSPKPTNPPPDEYFHQTPPTAAPEPTTLQTRPSIIHDPESEFTMFPMITAAATGPPKDYHELATELAASPDEPVSESPESPDAEIIEEQPSQPAPKTGNSKGVGRPPPTTTSQDTPIDSNYVAICAALKDVPSDLPEWLIHHYHHLSISHFYIMDDGSSPPLSTFPLPSSIPSSAVTFAYQQPENRTGGHSQQLSIYSRCLQKWGSKHTWMAFIDGDEFFEMTAGNETFPQFLQSMEDEKIGAVAVNWRMHTSSGYLTRPDSVRKAFTNCIWDGPQSNNSHTKSIVRTEFAERPQNPHIWYLKDGRVTVGEQGDLVDGNGVDAEAFRTPVTRGRVALHHYAGKSREEYEEKMLRGNAMDDPKGEGFWDSLEHKLPKVACLEMAFYDP